MRVPLSTAGGLLAFAACASACEHVVTIDSSPPKAMITVDGERLGEAPVTLKEKTGWRRTYLVEAQLQDEKKTVVKKRIEQTEWHLSLTATAVCCSLGLGSPLTGVGALPLAILFFSRQLPDQVVIALPAAAPPPREPAPVDAKPAAPAAAAPAEPVVPTPFSY